MKSQILLVTTIIVGVIGFPTPDNKTKIDPTLGWRVVGGTDAPNGAYPYQVSLRDSRGKHFCGGTILKPTIILTAAHCVAGVSYKDLSVVVGSHKLDDGGTEYQVKDIRSHNDYNPFTIENDIAILKLSSSISYSKKVAPIETEQSDVGPDVVAVLTGWGSTSYPGGSTPNNLQQLTLKTITNSDCAERHGSLKQIFESQICTLTKSGEGACHGDSGGPLVVNGVQVGIVSWGRPCGISYPDVFTRVSFYSEWIKIYSY